jgi:hypothetical protein
MSFFQRKATRSETVESAGNDDSSTSSTERPMTTARTARPEFSPQRFERTSSVAARKANDGFGSGHGMPERSSTVQKTAEPAQSPTPDESYTGPVITPGAEYTIGRDLPIESWPHAPRTVNGPLAIRLRKNDYQAKADDFAPAAPPLNSTPVPTELPRSDSGAASVPLLLPPGP